MPSLVQLHKANKVNNVSEELDKISSRILVNSSMVYEECSGSVTAYTA